VCILEQHHRSREAQQGDGPSEVWRTWSSARASQLAWMTVLAIVHSIQTAWEQELLPARGRLGRARCLLTRSLSAHGCCHQPRFAVCKLEASDGAGGGQRGNGAVRTSCSIALVPSLLLLWLPEASLAH
jgi:hypothetical protein